RRLYRRTLAPALFLLLPRPPPRSTLFPYTTLFRSAGRTVLTGFDWGLAHGLPYVPRLRSGRFVLSPARWRVRAVDLPRTGRPWRSEEHTSELQSRFDLVCRLLLEKKKSQDTRRRRL